MADKIKVEGSKIDALYQWISYDLQRVKGELLKELKLSSLQVKSMYEGIKGDNATSSLGQEIRYGYKQNQNIYEGITSLVKGEVADKIRAMEEKIATIDQVLAALNDLNEFKYSYPQLAANYEGLYGIVSNEILPKLDTIVDKEGVREVVADCVAFGNQEVLGAVASIPAPEAVDYERITAEVGDKLLELLNALKAEEQEAVATEEAVEEAEEEVAPVEVEIDYDRIAGDTAAKVIESLPYNEGVDYDRIDGMVIRAVEEKVNVQAIAEAVSEKVNAQAIALAVASAINVEAIADAVAARITPPAVDYDQLAELVVEKLVAKGISADIILEDEGIARIANGVSEKLSETETVDYAKLALAVQAVQAVPAPVDYDRVACIVEEKLANHYDDMERVLTLDEEGVDKIVSGVAEELRNMTLVCEYVEEEPAVEEAPVEIAEEAPIAEEAAVEDAPVVEELAASVAPIFEEDVDGQLVDAETGLVVRLKRSFVAKLKQSEEQVKAYYSDIKNALTSYKRLNSNVSWHGDRFNLGRETVAKMGINGKTLCFYLALDPNDPELKTTVYHQKDVGNQKAYESTPFMVKVKSDAAAKKALRLVSILAQKLGVEEDESFQEVDYVAEYAYESTKSLFEHGDIKVTKEKKADFNF